jgi:uncharacterized radical SAM protein YgiQ
MTEKSNAKHAAVGFLPTSREEMDALSWDQADIILVSGDAYVDHPSFGVSVMGRLAESMGLRVAVLPQPNWRDDLRDFRKLGEPRLFFGVSAGAMDSMINHYTALKRRRSDDAYTPGGRAGFRPDMASVVYTRILKDLYPDVPVLLGGIEASMRRFSHYDYWQDKVMPSILVSSGADMLVYGMGEQAFIRILELMIKGVPFSGLHNIPQTAYLQSADKKIKPLDGVGEQVLPSHQACVNDKQTFARTFRIIEEASNTWNCDRLLQPHNEALLVVNPPYPPADEAVADLPYDLPYVRQPHPRYRKKPPIPAWEMIRFSVNSHRGCFGGCSFCTISAHQGKFIVSRSERSILQEVQKVTEMDGFKGHISDIGGPSANMYRMGGIKTEVCQRCKRPSCIFPGICANLNFDHKPMIGLYDRVLQTKGVKQITIGSGIRYDMLINVPEALMQKYGLHEYLRKVLRRHVSGRLKVAPEHTSPGVLALMRKPGFHSFEMFHQAFRKICREESLPWQLLPYFISGHPGCTEADVSGMASITGKQGLTTELTQIFTPTPLTLATTMYYTGLDPYTGKKVHVGKSLQLRRSQKNRVLGRGRGPSGSQRQPRVS